MRLLDAGSEPRVRLRYQVAGTQTEDLTMRESSSVDTVLEGLPSAQIGLEALASVTWAPAGQDELTSTMQLIECSILDVPDQPPEITGMI